MKPTLIAAVLSAVCAFSSPSLGAEELKIGTVDFQKCFQESKLGKQEFESLESMKKQMDTVILDKQKKLTELSDNLENEDYLDSISAEKETELKREFRALSQEYNQIQSQYLQMLQQAQYKVMQKLHNKTTAAADSLAQKQHFDLILNDEQAFFSSKKLDVTEAVVQMMDEAFANEQTAVDSLQTTGS